MRNGVRFGSRSFAVSRAPQGAYPAREAATKTRSIDDPSLGFSPILCTVLLTMQKKRALILFLFIFGALVFYVWNEMEKTRAYAVRIICWTIAKDLLTHTNSQRVSLIDSWSA